MFYDPMIAKLIGYGKTRGEAIDRLADALDHYVIDGPGHNRQFLRDVCDHPHFREGDITTAFIAEEYPRGYTPSLPEGDQLAAMRGLATLLVAERMRRMMALGGGKAETAYMLYDDAGEVAADITFDGAGASVTLEDQAVEFGSLPDQSARLYTGFVNGAEAAIQFRRADHHVTLMMGSMRLKVMVLPARAAAAQALMPEASDGAGAAAVLAPMPGLLTRMLVAVGDEVLPGNDIAVIEAMKMENLLKAEAGGTVAEVLAAEGDSLAVDQPIVRFSTGQ